MNRRARDRDPTSDQLTRRLTVINQFLEQVLDESLRLSDILLQAGFSSRDVESIRKHQLEPFVDTVCDRLVAFLHEALPQKRARVVSERFCLSRQDKPTLQTIANELGLSRERIRQLQNVGMRKLRSRTRRAAIEDIVSSSAMRVLHETGEVSRAASNT